MPGGEPTIESINALRVIASDVVSRVSGGGHSHIPSSLLHTWGEDGDVLYEQLADFIVWSQSPEGHRAIEMIGEDPDLFPIPFPFIIAKFDEQLFLFSQDSSVLGNDIASDFITRQEQIGPTLFHIRSPDEHLPSLRGLVLRYKAFATSSAIEYLRTVSGKAPAPPTPTFADMSLTVSADGDWLLVADARSPVIDALREKIVPTWQDRDSCWLIKKEDIAFASSVLTRFGLDIPESARAKLQEQISPILAMGTLDDLREIELTRLKGMGDRRAEKFSKVGIGSIYDLLLFVPRKYLDRSKLSRIRDVQLGEDVAIVGQIINVNTNMQRRILKFTVADESGSITATFFNALWQAKRFKSGDRVILLGKVEEWRGRSRVERQITNPIMEAFSEDTHPVIPVYPQSAKNGISTWEIKRATEETIRRIHEIADPVPEFILQRLELPDRAKSLSDVHFPHSLDAAEKARDRLAFDELFRLQLALLRARQTMETETAVTQNLTGELTDILVGSLPFPLTSAQERAWGEVRKDISAPVPMHRLVQGDVGSGKTLIAILALLAGVEGGNQGALMAPTEILATQLYLELNSRLEEAGLSSRVNTALLTSKTKARERKQILQSIADGTLNIVVGTHSLIGAEVHFSSLGVVVVDEQHRFGVEQRAALRAKVANGGAPDMLVMTATPIPRTAAITAFGDLDVSVIDELPPGRTPIDTIWVPASPDLESRNSPPWGDVLAEVENGRQAFVVCPLVEDSEKLQAASATETFESLAAGALRGLRLLLVHGQQKPEERAAAMTAFAAGEADILVSTTVIEVGVNVPNASRMVILNADRFGIAQLHQLRGRVGRGVHASRCYLIAEPSSSDGEQRLQALCDSTDGFYLSEVDLSLRGAGNILGSEQSGGVSDFRVADILRDKVLLEEARSAALELIQMDSTLSAYPLIRREVMNAIGEEQAAWLFKS